MWTNKQEIYEHVRDHLLRQSAQSRDDDGSFCTYRGVGGLQCAVGCLMSDSDYSPKFEGLMVRELPDYVIDRLGGKGSLDLLTDLQNVHDLEPPRHWKRALADSAAKHGLKP